MRTRHQPHPSTLDMEVHPLKLSAHQEMRLRNVTAADNDYRRALIDAAAVARQAKEAHVAKFLFERDRAVRLAVTDGVPKNQLLQADQGLHTTATATIRESLARTEDIATTVATEETDPYAARYLVMLNHDDTEVLRITLTPQELEVAAKRVNYDASEAGPAPTSADFRITEAGRLAALEGMTVGNTYERHPVVAWAYDSAENETEAIAWFTEQTTQEVAA